MDQNQGLSKQDVLNMIRFGADAIFSAKEAHEITDEDIDAILGKFVLLCFAHALQQLMVRRRLRSWKQN